jgi:3-hydroxybutyryl-CoA dehydrogenase
VNRETEHRSVGIVGAGIMGCGIAVDLVRSGYQVTLVDISTEILEQSKQRIIDNARAARLLGSGPADALKDPLKQVACTTEISALRGCNMVIENVTENWAIKKALYSQLDAVCGGVDFLAANTSVIPITKLAELVRCKERVIGLHFMNPVSLKKAVEVIVGKHTAETTVQQAHHFLSTLGKEAILVKDNPGFISNRLLMLIINEASWMVQEETAQIKAIDTVFRKCFGHPMGPFETADLIGLDTILQSLEGLYENLGAERFAPCPLLKEMVASGKLGRKSGSGFYDYA